MINKARSGVAVWWLSPKLVATVGEEAVLASRNDRQGSEMRCLRNWRRRCSRRGLRKGQIIDLAALEESWTDVWCAPSVLFGRFVRPTDLPHQSQYGS